MMKEAGYKCAVIFGGAMGRDERDEYITKFRKREVNVLITTNILARGIDIPTIDLVINFDVPLTRTPDGKKIPDNENYLHRIGRAGRFGKKGIAVSIYDRDEDENALNDIVGYFEMANKMNQL